MGEERTISGTRIFCKVSLVTPCSLIMVNEKLQRTFTDRAFINSSDSAEIILETWEYGSYDFHVE